MKLIRSIHSTDLPRSGCALTIGNFDAVHSGHRKILQTLVEQSQKRRLTSVVMTFDPHPREYFASLAASSADKTDASAARLTTTTTRFFALRDCAIQVMLSVKFNHRLSITSAEQFIREHLIARLNMKYLLVGDDFRFGAKRTGDFQQLAEMASQYDYQVERFDTIQHHHQRISSTRIRSLLAAGELRQAAQLLGRNYTYSGRVIHGDKRGREWGFPTINLAIRHHTALDGVFAVRVSGLTDHPLLGVASIGKRPTLRTAHASKNLLEVHLLDYHGDAYQRRVCVEFVEKIRDQAKFADYRELSSKIAEDARISKKLLSQ